MLFFWLSSASGRPWTVFMPVMLSAPQHNLTASPAMLQTLRMPCWTTTATIITAREATRDSVVGILCKMFYHTLVLEQPQDAHALRCDSGRHYPREHYLVLTVPVTVARQCTQRRVWTLAGLLVTHGKLHQLQHSGVREGAMWYAFVGGVVGGRWCAHLRSGCLNTTSENYVPAITFFIVSFNEKMNTQQTHCTWVVEWKLTVG